MVMNYISQPHYVTKSFWCIGKRLDHCLGCKYCRELDGATNGLDIQTVPSEVNPLLSRIPVAVNLFYGDPLIQIHHTIKLLEKLEKSGHTGPVVIITKGDFTAFPNIDFNLDLHFAFSMFGKDSPLNGGSVSRALTNLDDAKRRGRYKYSIEFRPIIYKVNDDPHTIDFVMSTAANYGMAVGFSGLQGKPAIIDRWIEDKLIHWFRPHPGHRLSYKKTLPNAIEQYIMSFGVPAFRKTSCLISYVHKMKRDYNAHYYRPNEVGCAGCVMEKDCMYFKDFFKYMQPDTVFDIPFGHQVVKKDHHICPWLHKGCSFPTEDCSNLSGYFIEISKPVTTSDVRVIKWLTGLTVSSEFVDSAQLSSDWSKS